MSCNHHVSSKALLGQSRKEEILLIGLYPYRMEDIDKYDFKIMPMSVRNIKFFEIEETKQSNLLM